MRILVDVCIITLALLGCDLSDKLEQVVQTFFENSQSSDMSSDEIVTEGIFSNLKLYVAEHYLLVDIKKTLYALQVFKSSEFLPPLTYNEEYFNKFFLDLGSERSKEPINLFDRIKNDRNDRFKHEVDWLYSCISDSYFPDVKYFNYNESGYTNDAASTFKIKNQFHTYMS
ncbi:P52 family lipoprotein [Borreliella garinii]|uniref:P52 family lipoprotein n=1 Tax=Borreliella garinii TaxID=29519 RepID=UPI0004DAD971|nr:P52 family lipoprotein [Borreliella garinii]KEO61962.1 membrane protein [Borreliella garinii]